MSSTPLQTDDAAVTKRWTNRLRIRKRLLAEAREDLEQATTPEERKAAKAKARLRREQVEFAEAVLARRAKPKTTARERAVRAAMLGVNNCSAINYTQGPARWEGINGGLRAHRGQYPRNADCSSFVTWCIWDALGGAKAGGDIVNGANWTAGYTGTQCSHGKVVPLSRAQPGDLVFYAGSNGVVNHVAMLVAPGRVVSHGSQPGPMLLDATYRPVKEVRSYLV
jgi:cell wall-associated NlpC family hydrolase